MAWLSVVLVATLALAAPSAEDFERGKTAFGRAEYARAIGILRPLLYPEVRLDSEADVVQVHRLLGVANLFENHPDEARHEFRKLLELRPDYRFDPLLDPPRVVEFFNRVAGSATLSWPRAASARPMSCAPLRSSPSPFKRTATRSTSSPSAPASFKMGSAARGGPSWASRPPSAPSR